MTSAFSTSATVFVIALLFAATLLAARREFALPAHIRIWAMSFTFLAISHACRMIVLDAPAAGTFPAYLARMALVASVVLLAAGFRQRIGRGMMRLRAFAVTVALLLFLCWVHGSDASLAAARFVTALTVVAMIGVVANCLRGRDRTTFIARGITLFYGSYMLLLSIAAWFVWMDGRVTEATFTGLTVVGMPVATVGAGILVLLVLVSDLAGALRSQAARDPLTRLLNRRGLEERMRDMPRAEGVPMAVIAADLDRFKQINDQMGHDAGDRVLIGFADHLRDAAADFVLARTGGEEFLLIAAGLSEAEVVARAQTICDGVMRAGLLSHGIAVTSSFGIAFGSCADPWDRLAIRADQALYRAKAAGRNRVAATPLRAA